MLFRDFVATATCLLSIIPLACAGEAWFKDESLGVDNSYEEHMKKVFNPRDTAGLEGGKRYACGICVSENIAESSHTKRNILMPSFSLLFYRWL